MPTGKNEISPYHIYNNFKTTNEHCIVYTIQFNVRFCHCIEHTYSHTYTYTHYYGLLCVFIQTQHITTHTQPCTASTYTNAYEAKLATKKTKKTERANLQIEVSKMRRSKREASKRFEIHTRTHAYGNASVSQTQAIILLQHKMYVYISLR